MLIPVVGFYVGLFYIHGKKSLVPMSLANFLTSLVIRIFLLDDLLWVAIIRSLASVAIMFIEIYTFRFLFKRVGRVNYGLINFLFVLKFLLISIIVGALGGLGRLGVTMIFSDFNDIFFTFGKQALGSVFGILLFGSVVLFSFYNDSANYTRKTWIYSFIYEALFITIAFIIFSNKYIYFDFAKFSFVFFLLYIIAGIKFESRMLIFNNFAFIIVYSSIKSFSPISDTFYDAVININVYLFVITFAALIIKATIYAYNTKTREVDKANDTLRELIYSTNQLFSRLRVIESETDEFTKDFLSKMFRIACNIFQKFDKASCYLKRDEVVEFVAAKGFDVNYLNELGFAS